MSNRVIFIASAKLSKPKKITDFTGTTWGELKEYEGIAALVSGDVESILSPGNVALTRNDAQLPEGDFKVFIVSTKNKAGWDDAAAIALGKEIGEAIVKGAKLANENELDELKAELIEEIENFFDVDLDDTPADDELKAVQAEFEAISK